MNTPRSVGVGWDVGGAMGRKQGVAVICRGPDGVVQWLGRPTQFRLPSTDEAALTPVALASLTGAQVLDDDVLTVAIDAPLGFPIQFREMVAGGPGPQSRMARDIDDPFAFRECERWLTSRYKKKPMSGPHNMLGANASVAIGHTRAWRAQGYATLPFDDAAGLRGCCIEVYPALEKHDKRLADRWHVRGCAIPAETAPGTDAYDAAICAILALAFAEQGRWGLPALIGPPPPLLPVARREGWVYCAPRGPANE